MISPVVRAGLRQALGRSSRSEINPIQKRFSSEDGKWYYRQLPPLSDKNRSRAHCIATTTWAWVFWHLFTEPEHLYGHFVEPDVSAWTDEELGVIFPNFGPCWYHTDLARPVRCSDLDRNTRERWAKHLTHCFMNLTRSEHGREEIHNLFSAESESFCSLITSLQWTNDSLKAIQNAEANLSEVRSQVDEACLGESRGIVENIASLKAEQERLKNNLERTAGDAANFSSGQLDSLDYIIELFDLLHDATLLRALMWLVVPAFCVCILTVGEWTHNARWPLLVIWASTFISKDFVSSDEEEDMWLMLTSYFVSATTYVNLVKQEKRNFHLEMAKVEELNNEASQLREFLQELLDD